MLVIPISVPKINWNGFMVAVKQALGRSACDQLDTESANRWDAASYIAALSEIWHPGLPTGNAIRDAGNLLQHQYLSVMVVGSKELALEISQETDLAAKSQQTVVDGIYLTIVSGDLQRWRTSIINCSTGDESQGLRAFMNKCQKLFEEAGLGALWSEYGKKDNGDLTQLLIPK